MFLMQVYGPKRLDSDCLQVCLAILQAVAVQLPEALTTHYIGAAPHLTVSFANGSTAKQAGAVLKRSFCVHSPAVRMHRLRSRPLHAHTTSYRAAMLLRSLCHLLHGSGS